MPPPPVQPAAAAAAEATAAADPTAAASAVQQPELEPEPEIEATAADGEEAAGHLHAGSLKTDGGVAGAKLTKFWHVLSADLRFTWFKEKDARTLFDEIDDDGSGALNIDEIDQLCKQLGKKLSKKETADALAAMDEDGSGEISYDEFAPWWEKENAKAAAKRQPMGDEDLSGPRKAQLDAGDSKKETLVLQLLGKTLTMKADSAKEAQQWLEKLTELPTADASGSTSSSGRSAAAAAPTVSAAAAAGGASPARSARSVSPSDDEGNGGGGGGGCRDDDGDMLNDSEDERRLSASAGRGRRNASYVGANDGDGETLRDSEDERRLRARDGRGRRNAASGKDLDGLNGTPRQQGGDEEDRSRRHRSKHGRSSRKRDKQRSSRGHSHSSRHHHRSSPHRSSRSRSTRPRSPESGGSESEREYDRARERQISAEARRTRYADAPRYSDSHHGMSGSRHENFPVPPRGQLPSALPLRTYSPQPTTGGEYRPYSRLRVEGSPHVATSGYYENSPQHRRHSSHSNSSVGMSVAQQLHLTDDWEQHAIATPMLIGSGAVAVQPHATGGYRSHMLDEFRESLVVPTAPPPMEQRAVIIEPDSSRALNKYLRQGWRVKTTQLGDGAFLVIVERELFAGALPVGVEVGREDGLRD